MPNLRAVPGRLLPLIALAITTACAAGHNYPPEGPRYAAAAPAPPPAPVDTLRIVTFNIAWANHVDRAIEALTTDASLRDADVILLQEMDAAGTRRVAAALGHGFTYYPATLHPRTNRDFGNAVLSRWPIVEDAKIILPHPSRHNGTQRAATAATIQVGDVRVRVYSAHLGTITDVAPTARQDQLQAVIDDAARYARVVIGGDMNNEQVGWLVREHGFRWPTRQGPRTALVGRLDHIFVKGLALSSRDASGTVLDNRRASDHRPVWVKALIPEHVR